jgi:hypothetical protein
MAATPEKKATIVNIVMTGAVGYDIDLAKMACAFPGSRYSATPLATTRVQIDGATAVQWWKNGRYIITGLIDAALSDAMMAYCLPDRFKLVTVTATPSPMAPKTGDEKKPQACARHPEFDPMGVNGQDVAFFECDTGCSRILCADCVIKCSGTCNENMCRVCIRTIPGHVGRYCIGCMDDIEDENENR